jgi:hypothetical protein
LASKRATAKSATKAKKAAKATKAGRSTKPRLPEKSAKQAKPAKKAPALQTVRTKASVDGFLRGVPADRLADCREIIAMLSAAAGAAPEMWGPAIIGFGESVYRYPDGRTMDWMEVAFSPRKAEFTLYLERDFDGKADLLSRLGKHKASPACLYVKRLADVDRDVLRTLVTRSVAATRKRSDASAGESSSRPRS